MHDITIHQELRHRRQGHGQEHAGDAKEAGGAGHGDQREHRVHAHQAADDARDEELVLDDLYGARRDDHPEGRGGRDGEPHQDGRDGAERRAHHRHHLHDPGDHRQDHGVGEADEQVRDQRQAAHHQAEHGLGPHKAAHPRLGGVDDLLHVVAPVGRRRQAEVLDQPAVLDVPVEPEQEDGDGREERAHHDPGVAQGLGQGGQPALAGGVLQRFDGQRRRYALPEAAQDPGTRIGEEQAQPLIVAGERAGNGRDLVHDEGLDEEHKGGEEDGEDVGGPPGLREDLPPGLGLHRKAASGKEGDEVPVREVHQRGPEERPVVAVVGEEAGDLPVVGDVALPRPREQEFSPRCRFLLEEDHVPPFLCGPEGAEEPGGASPDDYDGAAHGIPCFLREHQHWGALHGYRSGM